jgi:type I restriction-modification system DNA methylase subunit
MIIEDIFHTLSEKLIHRQDLESLVLGKNVLDTAMMSTPQKPEEFTRQYVINTILDYLDFPSETWVSEAKIDDGTRRHYPDYVLDANGTSILVEAKALNVNLRDSVKGMGQVTDWIKSKASNSDYGIATNGFEWILIKFDNNTKKIKELAAYDIRPLFFTLCGQDQLSDTAPLMETFRSALRRENIVSTFSESVEALAVERERLSSKFYNDYLRIVFGVSSRDGKTIQGYNLLSALKTPLSAREQDNRLFCINFLNRLLFIKFLEEKGVIVPNFLKKMWGEYEKVREAIPQSFFKVYLEPLFFEVLNTFPDKRKKGMIPLFVDIPYLNGGLFRTIVPREREYDVDNDIVQTIILELIEGYDWGITEENMLNPDILGSIFEKTINYLTGTGTDRQKALGAYYTPEDVTSYITRNTVNKYIHSRILDALRDAGWSEMDLRYYASNDLEYFLSNLPRANEDVRLALDIVEELTVLDPACGSGHFLITALDELTLTYSILLNALNESHTLFDIKKHIITHNLYGNDIEQTATEITKLRLWLSLIESADFSEDAHMEVLPNIEYNILTGDSLVGWLDENLRQVIIHSPYDEAIRATIAGLRLAYYDDQDVCALIDEAEQAFQGTDLHAILGAYSRIKGVYSNESFKRAEQLKELIEIIRKNVYNFTSLNYFRYLHELSYFVSKKKKRLFYPHKKTLDNPTHWNIDVFAIMQQGGFDIVLGNPPYVEVSKKKRSESLIEHYVTASCGNTHAFFFERAFSLLKAGGFCGYIVPISAVSTDRMIPLQELLTSQSETLWVSNYDDRPGKIFDGIEDCRSSIIIAHKAEDDGGECTVYTTTYQRWYSRERDRLFEDIAYVDATKHLVLGRIPKLGDRIELSILDKIRSNNPLSRYLSDEQTGNIIYYHNAPRYWIRAMDFLPYFSNERDNRSQSLQNCEIYPIIPRHTYPIIAVLNSSLFYWYFTIMSDGRHLNIPEIESFSVSIDKLEEELSTNLQIISEELMADYKRNATRKQTVYQTTGKVEYDEFHPGKSKPIMDRIDDVLARHYGFTAEELDYIKNFSIEFRLGENRN